MKALVGAFNLEKALVGAFSVIKKTSCGTDGSFYSTNPVSTQHSGHDRDSNVEQSGFVEPFKCLPFSTTDLDFVQI